jgi:hypothetical protein
VAYRLKQLKNLYLVFGDAVHRTAEMVIRRWHHTKQSFQEPDLVTRVRKLMNQAYKDSLNKSEWLVRPAKITMLSEIYYEGELPTHDTQVLKERIGICIGNFLRSSTLNDFTRNPYSKLIELEKLNSTTIQDTKVYIKTDLLYKMEDKYIVADWKTGREDDRIEDQLLLYAYYVHEQYGIPYENIELRTEYLLTGECSVKTVEAHNISLLLQWIESSISIMKGFLSDVNLNQPLPVSHFPGTSNISNCKRCNFREICDVKSI